LLLTLSRPVHELHLASLKIINEVVDSMLMWQFELFSFVGDTRSL
jgi:hypothetical protein